jgi:hypothetical protein
MESKTVPTTDQLLKDYAAKRTNLFCKSMDLLDWKRSVQYKGMNMDVL